jgi:hypothetical protein
VAGIVRTRGLDRFASIVAEERLLDRSPSGAIHFIGNDARRRARAHRAESIRPRPVD